MTFFPPEVQRDLGPLAERMADSMVQAAARVWVLYGRAPHDRDGTHLTALHGASLLAAAMVGAAARAAGEFPIEAWAEANRLAQDPTSLINTSPVIPAPNWKQSNG